ncbi:hypothetical protein MLQ87_13865 [Escherichia coli]|uniref:hypothetical protein n=1 Tax=Klebsiella pneumoniae TaxID=573 RepID=UPI0003BEF0EE|nr:hypothetical protein [Klebsiella pneumoniae]ESL21023.1 hypothetical protein L477_03436 [Klebsiella pneumoniae BIDMC 40]MCN7051905.1 hypothetical protein [Escherichia coli]MCN7318591.1 hypothetical protein [Escherichia coli]
MAIPERMRPVKVTSKKIRELAQKAKEILAAIDGGASEKDAFLKEMIDEWNSQVVCPYEFSDFRDFSSWTKANEFTRIAFNLEKFYADFTWKELVQTINCVCDPKSKESEQNFALSLLERNFHGNPSDLIFWPDEWFQDPDMLDVELSAEEIACYLMVRSGRQLVDAPEIDLKYQMPKSDE